MMFLVYIYPKESIIGVLPKTSRVTLAGVNHITLARITPW